MEDVQPGVTDRSLRQKLDKMFTRYDYVAVKNITDKDFEWKVALEQNEVLGMSPADPMNEERMAQRAGGQFLPGDGPVRMQQKVTRVVLKKGEQRMIIGEAAYVVVQKIFNAFIREKYGNDKSALAKLRNPSIQDQIVPTILPGPIVNNIGQAVETFVNEKMDKIESFTDVQTKKGFSDPAVLAKAQATREANRLKAQTAN